MMSAEDCMQFMLMKINSLRAVGKFVDWRDKVRELEDKLAAFLSKWPF